MDRAQPATSDQSASQTAFFPAGWTLSRFVGRVLQLSRRLRLLSSLWPSPALPQEIWPSRPASDFSVCQAQLRAPLLLPLLHQRLEASLLFFSQPLCWGRWRWLQQLSGMPPLRVQKALVGQTLVEVACIH